MITQDQLSAGGVIYRRDATGTVEVALIATRGGERWGLPKGLVAPGEEHAEAALREVREETGLDGEIVHPLTPIEYWYWGQAHGQPVRYHKRVYFFLMACRAGDVRHHDWEVDDVQWIPIGKAVERASFPTERSVLAEAEQWLTETGA